MRKVVIIVVAFVFLAGCGGTPTPLAPAEPFPGSVPRHRCAHAKRPDRAAPAVTPPAHEPAGNPRRGRPGQSPLATPLHPSPRSRSRWVTSPAFSSAVLRRAGEGLFPGCGPRRRVPLRHGERPAEAGGHERAPVHDRQRRGSDPRPQPGLSRALRHALVSPLPRPSSLPRPAAASRSRKTSSARRSASRACSARTMSAGKRSSTRPGWTRSRCRCRASGSPRPPRSARAWSTRRWTTRSTGPSSCAWKGRTS